MPLNLVAAGIGAGLGFVIGGAVAAVVGLVSGGTFGALTRPGTAALTPIAATWKGAVTGGAGSGAKQVTTNITNRRPVGQNVLRSVATGTKIGALEGLGGAGLAR